MAITKEEFEQEVSYYMADIRKYLREEDFTSANIMITGLRKLASEYRKSKRLK